MKILFGKYRGRDTGEVPDTYLDWLLGEEWFLKDRRNGQLINEIAEELAIRKRSHAQVEDERGRTLDNY